MLWTIMFIAGGIGAVLALAVVALAQIGARIPAEHTATSALTLAGSAEPVYRLIEDIAGFPKWAPGVTSVEMLPPKSGLDTCRMRMGRNSFVMTRTRHEPVRLLERTITDDHAHFSGTWLYTIEPIGGPAGMGGGVRLRLTETGRVSSAIARACMKHIFGYHVYTHKHLAGVAKALGQAAAPRKA